MLPQRKLHRLRSWDYSEPGYYHITICTHNKRKFLSNIHLSGFEAVVELTPIGEMVHNCLKKMNTLSPYVRTDCYCIMPNHVHCIIVLEKKCEYSVSTLMRGFKSTTTREFRKQTPEKDLWQSSFYDEIIRNDEMLANVRQYITGNPSKWMEDSEYVP